MMHSQQNVKFWDFTFSVCTNICLCNPILIKLRQKRLALCMKRDVHSSHCRDLWRKYTKYDAKVRRKQKNAVLVYKSVVMISRSLIYRVRCVAGGKAHYIHWYCKWRTLHPCYRAPY